MISVVYVSAATQPFGTSELGELLTHSRASNSAAGVTGLLLYRSGRFLQVLEGPEQAVLDLMERIRHDARHTDIRVLLRERIDHRRFAEWTMGYEPIGTPAEAAPEGFRDTFDDLESSDDSVVTRAVRELTVWFRVRSAPRD